MLIVRGVNVFPSAVRELVGEFAPRVSGQVVVRPKAEGPKQDPPLPVASSWPRAPRPTQSWPRRSRSGCARRWSRRWLVELVPFGCLERSEVKSKLVER